MNQCPNNKPLVSVITSIFNNVSLLSRTIESVRSQCGVQIEYIVIDGGSTDGTLDVIRKYEPQIDYWVSEPDMGIYDAWNKGILASHGEWIAFLGAGDVYNPGALSAIVQNVLQLKFTPDLISTRVEFINIAGKKLREWGDPFVWNEFRK